MYVCVRACACMEELGLGSFVGRPQSSTNVSARVCKCVCVRIYAGPLSSGM